MKGNWEQLAVKDLAEVKGGKRLPAGEDFDIGVTPFPYLRVTNMVNGTIDDSDLKFVKVIIEPFIRNYKISKDDIYVTIAGTLGNFGLIPEHLDNAQLTENAAKLTEINFEKYDKEYLNYYLNSDELKIQLNREIGIGGGVPKLALHRIEKLVISSPPLPQQKKIAKILSTCDEVIAQTEAAIAKYQAIKQGMMHDLFTLGIDLKTGKLRPKYQDAPELYKDSELGMIPKEWEVKVITDGCSEIFLGLTTKVDYVTEGGVPLIRAKDVNTGYLKFDEVLHISNKQHKELTKNRKAKRGDVLITKSGTLGISALVDSDIEFSIYESIIVLQPELDSLISEFLLWLLREPKTIKRLLGESVGSTIGHLNLLDFRELKTVFPSILEQSAISYKLIALTNKIETEKSSLAKVKEIKSGLMHDLLTGKVEVTI